MTEQNTPEQRLRKIVENYHDPDTKEYRRAMGILRDAAQMFADIACKAVMESMHQHRLPRSRFVAKAILEATEGL